MTPRRITVLGAGGFIGSHLIPALLSRFACEVDAVDIDFHKLSVEHPRLRCIPSRIEAPGLVPQLVAKSDLVISLSALCNPALYSTMPLAVIDANYTHLLPVVQCCASAKVRLLHFSTSEVYGRMALDAAGNRAHTMSEAETGFFLGPVDRERWTYACAKQLLERVIWAHGEHGSLPFTVVRLFNVIGPRMDFLPGVDGEGVPRVLAMFMNALLRGEALQLVEGGTQRRAFMAVQDCVEAVCRIVERPDACRNQILNLGNPSNDISIAELARLLCDVFATRVPGASPARMRNVTAAALYGEGYDDSQSRIPDVGKANQLLDWYPRLSLPQMLPGIVDSYVQQYGLLHGSVAS